MNNFLIQGRILYKEQKHENGSVLILLETGKDLKRAKALVYPVNKVLIRIPARMARILNNIQINDYVEVMGGFIGRVYYPIGGKRAPIGVVQMTATHIHLCRPDSTINTKDLPGLYQSRFLLTCLVKGIKEPVNKKGVNTLFVQTNSPIKRIEGEVAQHTAVIPVLVSNYMRPRLEKLRPNQYVMLEGSVGGVTTKIPIVNNPGEFEERLEVSLFATNITNVALVPEKLFLEERKKLEDVLKEQESLEAVNG